MRGLTRLHRRWWGLVFVLPVVAFFATFSVFPVLFGIWISLTDYNLLDEPLWVGLANYRNLLDDQLFLTAFKNTLVFVLGATLPVWVLSLLAALLFDQAFRGREILKTLFFLPVLPPVVVVAVVWRMLLHPNGVMTWIAGGHQGVTEISWLASTTLAPIAMIVVHDWAVVPFFMVVWLAGFAGVPKHLREAARMDGASEWRVYRHIVFPHLSPITLSALIILGHISIKVFDLIVAVAGKQLLTEVPAVYMWVLIFDARDYAKGAAIATLLLLGISVLIVPYLWYVVRTERRT